MMTYGHDLTAGYSGISANVRCHAPLCDTRGCLTNGRYQMTKSNPIQRIWRSFSTFALDIGQFIVIFRPILMRSNDGDVVEDDEQKKVTHTKK